MLLSHKGTIHPIYEHVATENHIRLCREETSELSEFLLSMSLLNVGSTGICIGEL